jgi:magnesium-transporting ATPase (P-type)
LKHNVKRHVSVIYYDEEKKILTQQLVPGDILCINPLEDKVPFHCDAVLVEGTCSVDESMLTGESYPITKVSRLSKATRDSEAGTFSCCCFSDRCLYPKTKKFSNTKYINDTFYSTERSCYKVVRKEITSI